MTKRFAMGRTVILGAIKSAKRQNSLVYLKNGGQTKAKNCTFKVKKVKGGYTAFAYKKKK
jgi:hypothetical protein